MVAHLNYTDTFITPTQTLNLTRIASLTCRISLCLHLSLSLVPSVSPVQRHCFNF